VIVLGLDPGTRHFGWGVVEKLGTRLFHRAHGIIHTREQDALCDRLVTIEAGLVAAVAAHHPTAASIESIFFDKNVQSAVKLGHARGVALLVCARAGLSVAEYAPALVKRAVSGSGRAEKSQVAQMVRIVLGLGSVPIADAADALAVAVTHLQHSPLMGNSAGERASALRLKQSARPSSPASGARGNIRGRSPV
jgi:crossover junction endodeoxyribonuclease RuvC